MRLLNLKIYTMRGGVIEHGFIETADAKITRIGGMDELGADEQIPNLDAEGLKICAGDFKELNSAVVSLDGKICTPGFIDAHTHIGMWEDSLGFPGEDGNEDTDPCTPQLRAIDGINPFDICFKEAALAGVTTVCCSPGSSNPVAGQTAILKTQGRSVDDMIIKSPAGIKFALGENPKSTYRGKDETPVTRMATAAIIREQLKKTRQYMEKQYMDDNEPDFDFKCESMIPLLKGEIQAHFHAHRADDICTALRICDEFDLKPVIVHGTEAPLISDILTEKRVPVLYGPVMTDRSKPELKNLSESVPAELYRNGVKTAVISDHPEVPEKFLSICAGLCGAGDNGDFPALQSVTNIPAEILHIGDRVGSLGSGMDADLLIFDSEPVLGFKRPSYVFIDGKIVK